MMRRHTTYLAHSLPSHAVETGLSVAHVAQEGSTKADDANKKADKELKIKENN